MTEPATETPATHAVLCHAPDAPVALLGQTCVTAARFRQDVTALAALLPPTAFAVNLCQDRYRFMVGFAAALMRSQVTLMPSANTPGLLKDLAEDYPDLYALTDVALPDVAFDLPHLPFPDRLAEAEVEAEAEAEAGSLLIPGAQPAGGARSEKHHSRLWCFSLRAPPAGRSRFPRPGQPWSQAPAPPARG
jgi:hypothetical protein